MKGIIVFLIPPKEIVSGGILSIFSLAEESRRLESLHGCKVFVSVYPGSKSYKKNKLFKNSEVIYNFDELFVKNKNIDKLIIHMPEYAVGELLPELDKRSRSFPSDTHFNILNQNVEYMPPLEDIIDLYKMSSDVTQTVAHERYASQEIADRYSISTHLLTIYLDESQYIRRPYTEKDKIILYSSDEHSKKNKILQELKTRLPEYQLVEIKDVTYEQYKELISKAEYTITFGEGFDGYFIEPIFSGSIPLTVYNDTFFPNKEYKTFPNVFPTYENFSEHAVNLIKSLNNFRYSELNSELTQKLKKTYSTDVYRSNIRRFYEGHYSFLPSRLSLISLFASDIKHKDRAIQDLNKKIEQTTYNITSLKNELDSKNLELTTIKSSKAWILANQLRKIVHLGK